MDILIFNDFVIYENLMVLHINVNIHKHLEARSEYIWVYIKSYYQIKFIKYQIFNLNPVKRFFIFASFLPNKMGLVY